MILEFEKKVNPFLLLEELRVIDSRIGLITRGERIEVLVPDDLSNKETEITVVVEAHVFVEESERGEQEEQQLKGDFNNATTIAQIKIVLKKKFGW